VVLQTIPGQDRLEGYARCFYNIVQRLLTPLFPTYDQEHHDLDTQPRDPLSMLKYLMQESSMTQADLGRLLGNRALASLILNGRRQLSKSHIRKLANHFKLSPALFL
jgi:HTH-type transcriptional regulator / antitoxin HigA